MEIVRALTEYYLIHYKQQKENVETKLQDRLVVVLSHDTPDFASDAAKSEKTVDIRQLSLWERIGANFDFGPASKSALLHFIKAQKLKTSGERKQIIDEKVTLIFNKAKPIDVHTVLLALTECHNKTLMQDIVSIPEIRANINAKIKDGDTGLLISIKNNNREAFDVFIHTEAIALDAPNSKNEYTPLLLALDLGKVDFVEKLVQKGCSIPVKAFSLAKNSTPTLNAIKSASYEQKSALLVDAVQHSNVVAFKKIVSELNELDMVPALENAIRNDRLEMVETVLAHGIDAALALQVAIRLWVSGDVQLDSKVFTLLIKLNRNALQPALNMLAELYVGPVKRTKDEYISLIHAFVAMDEYINLQAEACYTVLVKAAQRGNWNFVEALIESGVSPDFEPDGASKLLLRAASRGNYECIKLLLEKGADPLYLDDHNNTPIKRAQLRLHHGHVPGGLEETKKVLNLLQSYGSASKSPPQPSST